MFKTGKLKFKVRWLFCFYTNSETAGVKTKSYYFLSIRVANANKRQKRYDW
jgi:hypothetical protein